MLLKVNVSSLGNTIYVMVEVPDSFKFRNEDRLRLLNGCIGLIRQQDRRIIKETSEFNHSSFGVHLDLAPPITRHEVQYLKRLIENKVLPYWQEAEEKMTRCYAEGRKPKKLPKSA